MGVSAWLFCVQVGMPGDLGDIWSPAELMRARVGIAYVGPSASFVSNPALVANIAGREFSLLTDVVVYSGKYGLQVLPKIYQKRRLLETYVENPQRNWSDMQQAFGDTPHEWGFGGVRIGLLEYEEKGIASGIAIHTSESIKVVLDAIDSTLYLHQGAMSLLVWSFALGRHLIEHEQWSISVGVGGKLWGFLNLRPVLLESLEALRGRITRLSSRFLWMDGQHGYGFRGDLGLIVRRRAKGFSVGLRVRNVISSYSGEIRPRHLDWGFCWRPFGRRRNGFVRSVTVVADALDRGPHFLGGIKPGLAIGSNWRSGELWVGRSGSTTTAGIGFFLRRVRFGYAILSKWESGLPAGGATHLAYLRFVP